MRRFGSIVLIAAGVLLIAVSIGSAWLLGTSAGARTLLSALSRFTPLEIRAEEVAGSLAGELRLRQLAVTWPAGEARIDEIVVDWRPTRLVAGELALARLAVAGATIEWEATATAEAAPAPKDLALPRLRLPFGLDAAIGRLHLQDMTFLGTDREPLVLAEVTAAIAWRDHVLAIDDLRAATSLGNLSGRARIDFPAPALQVTLLAEAAAPLAGYTDIEVRIDLAPASGARRMAGPVRVSAGGGEAQLVGEGRLDWSAERIAIELLRLVRPGRAGEVRGRVEISEPPTWRFAAALAAERLDLRPYTDFATDLGVEVTATGRFADYSGEIRLVHRGEGWRSARLTSPFAGGREAITFPVLQGEWLDGRLQGRVAARWGEGSEVTAELHAHGLNPARIAPEWQGLINFDLQGGVRFPGAGEPLQAQVAARLRESVLRGRALVGRLDGSLVGDDLRIAEFSLRGDGFELSADGRLAERIDFAAEFRNLSGVFPQGEGRAAAKGWVRWRDGRPAGAVAARGGEIEVGPVRVGAFELDAAYPGAESPFRLTAELRDFAYADWRVSTAAARGEGNTARHVLRVSAAGPDLRLRGAAEGSYAEGRWHGVVTELAAGGRGFGLWELQAPTAITLAAGAVRIEPFAFLGEGGERLAGSADLSFAPLRGRLAAQWQRLDLSLANRWLPHGALEGRTDGSAQMRWASRNRFFIEAEAEAAGTVIVPERRIGIRHGEAKLIWDAGGLRSDWRIDLADGGEVAGEVRSEAPGRPGAPPYGEAAAQWRKLNLAIFSPWLPPMIEASGDSSGIVQGRWREEGRHLQLTGNAAAAGRIAWRQLDLHVRQAATEFAWNDEGLTGTVDLDLGARGALRGRIASPRPVGAGLPAEGEIGAEWQELDLALLAPLLPEGEVVGRTGGRIEARWRADRSLDLAGRVDVAGRLDYRDLRLDLQEGGADVEWGERGLHGRFRLSLREGGHLTGTVTSPHPARLEVPESARIEAQWGDIDLALLRPWLPENILLVGSLAGNVAGEWLPGGEVRLSGSSAVNDGDLQWDSGEGVITAPLRQAELSWTWHGDGLRGKIALLLQDHGQAEGTFLIPLPARLPTGIDPEGEMRADFAGTLQEEGLLTAIMPGLLQESRGRLSFALRAFGKWRAPQFDGTVRLTEAGAYLPAAGLRLQDVALQGRLVGQELRVESFHVRSGPGRLEGEAVVRLQEWRLHSYRGEVRGEEFQAVNLPELELFVTPDLTFTGDREQLVVRGEVMVPQALVRGRETAAPVQPSPDVVIVDAPAKVERRSPLDLDVQVRIVLGEHVLVKAEGIDARLEGGVRLNMQGIDADQITAQGEIRVAQGTYAAYGVRLTIERGVLLFAGGPVDRPTLDLLAMRTIRSRQESAHADGVSETDGGSGEIGEVRAGVRVTGTPRRPEVRLTSEPTLPDTDVLAYIVLGHPLGRGNGNAGLLMTAAGALLSKGESATLQDQLRRTFGLDVLEIDAGSGDVAGSQITIGKYLSPSLYISFGQSLFTNVQEVRLRYDISRKWQLESSVGNESAVDLYYRIEFR